MPSSPISLLPSATIPLTGDELLPIVQDGVTVRVRVADLLTWLYPSAPTGGLVFFNGERFQVAPYTFLSSAPYWIQINASGINVAGLTVGGGNFSVDVTGRVVCQTISIAGTDLPFPGEFSGAGNYTNFAFYNGFCTSAS